MRDFPCFSGVLDYGNRFLLGNCEEIEIGQEQFIVLAKKEHKQGQQIIQNFHMSNEAAAFVFLEEAVVAFMDAMLDLHRTEDPMKVAIPKQKVINGVRAMRAARMQLEGYAQR